MGRQTGEALPCILALFIGDSGQHHRRSPSAVIYSCMWSMSCTFLYSLLKLSSEDACRYVTQDRLKAMLDYEYLQVSLSMHVSMH